MQSLRKSGLASVGLTILLMPFVACVAPSHAAESFTLDQALALAYESNPRLEAERASVRATDEEVAKALGGWRPQIGVSGSYGWTQNDLNTVALPIPNGHPRDVTVTLTQPLFTGTTIPQTRQANAQVRAARAQLTSVEQAVLQSAAQAYFNVVGDETALNFRRDNVQLLTDQLSMTQQRVNIGDVTVTDLQLVQARLSAAMADVSFSEAKLAASRAEFARAIGRPAESLEMAPRVPMQPEAIEQAVARAIENNPDLNAAREQQRVAEAAVDVAIGQLLPSLSVQGQYRVSRDEVGLGVANSSTAVLAQLRVPIYQGGVEYAGIRQAKQTRSKATFLVGDVERQVRQALDTAWQAQLAARSAMVSHEQQVNSAQMAYEGFAEGVRAGERSTYDLLNSAQELLSARVSLAEARRQYYIATYQLLTAIGGLTARSLNLSVKLYDPQIHYDNDARRWIGFGE